MRDETRTQHSPLAAVADSSPKLVASEAGAAGVPAAGDVQPLSSGQQSLWFTHQLAPAEPTYNLAFAARIRSGLDVSDLRLTFQALTDRHAALRTTFEVGDRGPVQRVHEHATVCFEEEDAAGLDESRLQERLVAEARRPFDLERGPLLKVHLFARPAGEYVLLLTAHHIILDFWSLAVLMHELGALYGARRSGARAELPPLARQYSDYVRWQDELLRSEEGELHRSYWQRELSGRLPVLELPTDRPRPPVQTYRGATHSFRLGPELTRRLKALSRGQRVTLYTTLLAAFQLLLHRYTGQEEILVGSPTSGRSKGWLAGLVGYLVNPVVLRAQLSGGQTFEEFLRQVRRTMFAAFEHQDYPFALLVQSLQPERDASRSPLFQVVFTLQKSPLGDGEGLAALAVGDQSARIPLGDVFLEPVPLPQRAAHFDLMLVLVEAGERLVASLEYNTDLFDATTVERMSRHFEVLLEGIVADPGARLGDLPILPEDERRQILFGWNETRRDYPAEATIHGLFERQARRTPDALALVFEGERLTYAQLDERTDRLAAHLRRLGVRVESRVGVLLERSTELVVALLGVLKAGGAYVPLDPEYPEGRLRFMAEDAGLSVLLTGGKLSELAAALAQGAGAAVVHLDELGDEPPGVEEARPRAAMSPDNLAYVIYTSGSTGRPKGVAIEHRSAAALLHWAHEIFDPEELSGTLASTSVCFDLSVFEIFAPLGRGGTVILARDALHLPTLAARESVTLINTVPSAMAELVRQGAVPASVRAVNLAGEVLKNSLAQAVYGQGGVRRVFNLYGPSEDTTYSTWSLVGRGSGREPTIGRPIANTCAYVLDGRMRPAPLGVPGELFLGGAGLARDYLRRPALTAERFVPDPFSAELGARLYRTGDLARWLPSGELEFLGRVDHQVKVRGFRIELGEVEAALLSQPGVRQAVVLAREAGADNQRLVAYVTGDREAFKAADVRRGLKERLPGYMVPSSFVLLEEWPLTPSGKVDRRRLPAPDESAWEDGKAFESPRTPVEDILASIYEQVLGVRDIGVHANFFELGGHSLLATQVVSRLNDAFNLEVPLHALFESPTVAALAEHVEAAIAGGRLSAAKPLVRAPRGVAPTLSYQQRRLWFLGQLEPEDPSYNMAGALRLKGPLDAGALEWSFNEVVSRHEALRTAFVEVNGVPVPSVEPVTRLTLPSYDLSALPEGAKQERLDAFLREEAERPFDLKRCPLLRLRLLRLAEDEHVLQLTMHHIISDGWSLGVLLRELKTFYESRTAGQPAELRELPVQYADYALWQRERLEGGELERQLAYWEARLAGLPEALELPTDRPRRPSPRRRGGVVEFSLPTGLTTSLKSLARREGATLFMTLLAGFEALLYRHTGQELFAVGTPVAGRGREEVRGLIGFFVNTLALRAEVSGGETFAELLGRVRGEALGGYGHQEAPFERVVERLSPARSLGRSPIFQVMLTLDNTPQEELKLGALRVERLPSDGGAAKYDLSLSLREEGGVLGAMLSYDAGLFDEATVRSLAERYEVLLEGAAADPARRISEVPLLTEEEAHRQLVEWNETRRDYPAEATIHGLFERQARRTPDALALVFEGERLTYAQLDERTDRLAAHLRRLGVRVESRVGVLLERSTELVVALLGVLKAGGAYVPLDPEYPEGRLRFMAEDAGLSVLLTGGKLSELAAALAQGAGAAVVHLDDLGEGDAGEEEAWTEGVAVSPDNLAYVIYTSGSTGRPKGAMLAHRGVVNRLLWMQDAYGLTADDRVLQKTPYSFDVSVWEFFWPLLAGATLVVARPGGHRDSAYLRDLIQRERVTTLHFVPPMLQLFLEEPGVETCESLRRVVCSGEALPRELQERFYSRMSGVELHNLYGPTEASVDVTAWKCERGGGRRAVPIGRPIANTRLYVLDREMRPVPVGVNGELYLGGVALARGYHARPALTAEKFVPDPFSAQGGGRLYRTGDVVRYLPDGNVEFLGRADGQVKVRGFRVELGEIEAALASHELVGDAVVVALGGEGEPGGRRLVAYVVGGNRQPPAPGELRAYLKEKLPEYMIPHEYVPLDGLPLTPNGKIDRRALPTPERSRAATGQDYVQPGTEVEELLAGIWAEVLRLERVGVTDDFFALGGHSLLATQIISRVRDLFKVEVPLQVVFVEPTVAGLGRSVSAALSSARGEAPPPIKRVPREREMPLSVAQHRLWFIDQLDPNSVAYNIPAAVRLTGPLNAQALERAFAEVVRRHESLRTTFQTAEDGPAQIIATEGAPPAMPLTDLRAFEAGRREAEVARLAGEEARRPFDLESGPLLRTALLRTRDDEHVLLLTMHHIVSDGWSMGVLMREVVALYEAFAGGAASPLSELSLQYVDFAVWQNERLRGGALASQLEYWARQLKGAPPTLEVPTDRRRPAVQSFRGAVCSLELPAELSESLRALCRREGVTMFMTLLAAFKGLLARYAGRRDIVVGTPVAGRNQTETEPLIGFFVNTLVLRTDLAGDPSFVELLRRVRGVVLGALAHQDVPFERLVEELQPERSLSHSPLFQVAFATPTSELPDLESSGLRLQPVRTDAQTSKFDLTLQVEAGDRLVASLEYNTDLFDAETIRRLLGHYEALLQGVTADPACPLSRLLRLDEGERRQAIATGRGARRDYTIACVHHLFERQAEAAPDRVAVADGVGQLTYGELNARANQLARSLRRMGVGREVRVGVLLERSVEMVVGWLSILKAGGAYVPLEPAYPEDRLRFMQHDAGLKVVLTEERLRGLCDEEASAFLSLDGEREAIDRESRENLPDGADVGNLVYVIYTSGSTGRPKGVEIEHRGLANLVGWVQDEYGLGGEFRASQVTSPGFDASTWEVWTCLTAGGSLHIVDDLTRTSAPALLEWLDAKSVEVCFLPTVMAEAVLGQQSPLPPSLKILFTGGDRLHRGLERELPFSVFNLYGPTENTVAATGAAVAVSAESGAPPPIGRPMANTEAYVLDEHLEPVPDGVPGELYLGGAGLARCYLKRPALTAERFVPHPFGQEPGARLYRTGDVARYLPDGNIEYLGRADEQVKLRGYRIEPGEIESALTQHPGVREAVVLMREDRPGDKRLSAYLVATGEPISRADLSNHLAEKLPRHMIPSAFVFLEALPLTANGKVDKRALPKPAPAGDKEAGAYVAPRNIKEHALADIWQLLLGVERVGVTDDFFALGGNSLLMMQVIARVQKIFDVRLPVAAFYQSPTIESLAESIRKLQRSPLLEAGLNLTRADRPSGRHSVIVELQPAGSNPPFFLAHTLGGHLGDCLALAQELGALEQPVYGLQARGLDDDAEPYTQIEEMANSYADAVLSVQAEGPFRLGGYCSGGLLAFEVAQRLRERGHEVELLALIGAQPTPGGSVSLADMRRDPEVLPIVAFCGELKIVVGEDDLRALDSTRRREKVWEEFRLQSPEYAENLGRTIFERLYRVYVADAVVLINNVPRPYAGRVVLFDFMEHHERLSQRAAWDELCLGPLERQEVSGNHITAMRRPNVRLLAQKLNASLNAPRRVALKRNRRTRQKMRPEAAS